MSHYDDDGFYYDDDHGPLDSPEGDSEGDHVWADLARSEQEPPETPEDGDVLVEVEYADGSCARWVLDANDLRVDKLDQVLGNPDTIRTG